MTSQIAIVIKQPDCCRWMIQTDATTWHWNYAGHVQICFSVEYARYSLRIPTAAAAATAQLTS